jgi:hypothetical protein
MLRVSLASISDMGASKTALAGQAFVTLRDPETASVPYRVHINVPSGGHLYIHNLGPSPLLARRDTTDDEDGPRVDVGGTMVCMDLGSVYIEPAIKDQGAGPAAFGLCIVEWSIGEGRALVVKGDQIS